MQYAHLSGHAMQTHASAVDLLLQGRVGHSRRELIVNMHKPKTKRVDKLYALCGLGCDVLNSKTPFYVIILIKK